MADVQPPEMVLTATKTPRRPQDVTQSVTVISGGDILKSGATNVAEALRPVAGMLLSEEGPLGSPASAAVRGSTARHVLILLDGIRLNSAGDGGYDLSQLPVVLDEIERIEIVRGPASALYGPEAAGGVVNIIRKKPATPIMTLGGALGGHGYRAASFYGTDRGANTYYALSLGYDGSKGYRENSASDRLTAGIKIGYDFDALSSLEATADYLTKDSNAPGPLQVPSPFASGRTRESVFALKYKSQFSRSFYVIVSAYQNQEQLAQYNTDPLSPIESRQRNVSTGADLHINWLMGSWNILTFGAEEREDRLVGSDEGTHTASFSSGFIQDEMRLGDLIVIVGGRHDALSSFGSRLNPRVSARYLTSENGTVIRGAMGRSFRSPSLDDLYLPDIPGTGAAGNPNLRPETIDEYEGGIEQPFGDNAILFSAFRRKVQDLIIREPDASFTSRPENIGRARISGTETSVRFSFPGTASGTVSYTRLFPVDETTGERIFSDASLIPHSMAGASLRLPLDDRTTLSLGGRWVRNYVRTGEEKWEYFSLDGKIYETFYSQKEGQGHIFIAMKNLFNRQYETIKGFPMPPHEFYGGVSLQF